MPTWRPFAAKRKRNLLECPNVVEKFPYHASSMGPRSGIPVDRGYVACLEQWVVASVTIIPVERNGSADKIGSLVRFPEEQPAVRLPT